MERTNGTGRARRSPPGRAGWAHETWKTLMAGVAAGMLSASAAWAWAISDTRPDPTAQEIAAFDERFPLRELPREWRWQGRQYRFDHMFRER